MAISSLLLESGDFLLLETGSPDNLLLDGFPDISEPRSPFTQLSLSATPGKRYNIVPKASQESSGFQVAWVRNRVSVAGIFVR